MGDDLARRAREVFLHLLDLPAEVRRTALDAVCGGDGGLRREVASLLEHEGADEGRFLEPEAEPASSGGAGAASADEGRRIGPYVVLREIGRGGQGAVYLAADTRLPRHVALKVLWPSAVLAGELLQRFRREAEVASRLDHPGICGVYDAGADDGVSWIAMRFIPGETLAQRIASARRARAAPDPAESGSTAASGASRRGPDDPHASPSRQEVEASVALFEKAARAVHAAHEAGVTHRDLKPGNIMVTPEGEPVILDFGLARCEDGSQPSLTRTGDVFGTPAYMSPEQVAGRGGPADRRSDVYSLGVSLYESLSLRRPFEHATREGLYQLILAGDATGVRRLNRAVASDLDTVVGVAMDRAPDRRYQTALDLAEDLRRVLAREPIRARPPGALVRLARWVQRHPGLTGGVAGAFLFLAAGLVVSLGLLADAKEQAEQFRREERRSQRRAYRATLVAAAAALAGDEQPAARRSLEDAPPELRGFEWRHLRWVSDRSTRTIDLGRGGVQVTAVDPVSGNVLAGLAGGALAVVEADSGTVVFHEGPGDPGVRWLDAGTDGTAILFDRGVVCREPYGTAERWRRDDLARPQAADLSEESGRLALLLDGGARVRILDAGTGRDLASWAGPPQPGARLRFADGGARCVVSSTHGTWMYDAATGAELWRRPEIWGVPSLSGNAVLAHSRTVTGSALLDGASGALRWERDFVTGFLRAIALSADGSVAAEVEATGTLVVRDGMTGAIRSRHSGAPAQPAIVEVLPDGAGILTITRDGGIRFWDARAGSAIFRVPTTNDCLNDSAFAADGRRIASAGWGGLKIWDADAGAELRTVMLARTMLHACAWSPDGPVVATGGVDRVVHLVDGGSGAALGRSAPLPGEVLALAWTPDGRRILAGLSDGGVVAAPAVDQAPWTVLARLPGPVRSLAISPDGTRAAAGCGLRDGGPSSGTTTGTGEERAAVAVLDLRGGKTESRWEGHAAAVLALAFDPAGERLVSGDESGAVVLRHLASGAAPAVRDVAAGRIHGAAFSPDGARLALGCADEAVHVWDGVHFEELVAIRLDGCVPRRFRWDGDRLLVSGGSTVFAALETGPPAGGFGARDFLVRAREVADAELARAESSAEAAARIERDEAIAGPLRPVAAALARGRGDQINFLNSSAWGTVLFVGRKAEDYERALRTAELAARTWPGDYGFRNTLGVAQYRAGRFEEARETLRRCEEMRREAGRPLNAADVLMQALAEHRLGRPREAADLLDRARALIPESPPGTQEECSLFLREAEALIGSR